MAPLPASRDASSSPKTLMPPISPNSGPTPAQKSEPKLDQPKQQIRDNESNGGLGGASPADESMGSSPRPLESTDYVTAERGAAIPESGDSGTEVSKPVGSIRSRRASEGNNVNIIGIGGSSPNLADKAAGGTATPPGRRSVQFARPALLEDHAPNLHSRQNSVSRDPEGQPETPGRDRRGGTNSLFLKLRSLVPSGSLQTHGRSQSAFTIGSSSNGGDDSPFGPLSPDSERDDSRVHDTLHEESIDGDADAEESGLDDIKNKQVVKRRRKSTRRPHESGTQTAPVTPKTPTNRAPFLSPISASSKPVTEPSRPPIPRRRATMTDMSDQERAGVSEGEGRDRLGKTNAWKRGGPWSHAARGQSFAGVRVTGSDQGTPDGRRPLTLRRLTGFGTHDGPGEGSPSAARRRVDRGASVSAAKWRSLKAGLKMIGQKKKEENKTDTAKSAELLAELAAGTPAALILASMFQRDEHGNKRIPILLEQLKIQVTDSKKIDDKSSSDRHVIFRIELEYGSGLTRMKWVINRSLRDFVNLHLRYKLQQSSGKYKQLARPDGARQKLPHFPKSAFPYLRAVRGLGSDDEDSDDEDDTAPSGAEGGPAGPERPAKKRAKRRPSFSVSRRKSSIGFLNGNESTSNIGGAPGAPTRRDPYVERQRRKLEQYIQKMLRHLAFRADSNRLCKFLEISALGVRLAAEGSYHGKEGSLIIQSAKGLDFRRSWQPSQLKNRHTPKWFLVRHSYIVCVDSPEQMNIYDVFLVDEDFVVQPKKRKRDAVRDKNPKALAIRTKESATHQKHHTLKICNSERRLKLLAKNERLLHQFEESVRFMHSQTPWSRTNRFGSFAPVRQGVFAQWLVDGRDHMWNVSRAISMARDVVYIHDWWLSPELYMRRPAAISQKWRLDRLLQRKAQEGVKIFVIMYRNINSAIPIDSQYSKFSLLDLHPNVFVQRSPNQARQGAFFWAHHEKLCVVDHTVAFVGGIDLCFGRWDTPQHSVADDKLTGYEESETPKDADHCQLWPGKDYSNPRVQDFYALDKPYEEMYDRTKIPRMPWHDISMQVVGQPARDLTRHFVQRWNFILRQRSPTRPTPFLLPPADFNPADLEALGLDGTCEVQILRSSSWWSTGTPGRTEHSIMDAYIKMIEQSDHFVYLENQFFITSCEVEGTKIENLIGDAIVERIIRAYKNGEDWRAVIVIPLMPGFQNTVDEQDGTSVRLIMQCQFRSICRGETSIFGRLRAQDIEPEDYIQFYGLRAWGRIGPKRTIVTEQLYIHAKCMIVDDRIAIIGSANINERSMLGHRDSECAAVVRDTDMISSTMNGEPYRVGRFPHTLRMRLMREHLGLDVDAIEEEERDSGEWERDMDAFHSGNDSQSAVSDQINGSPSNEATTSERKPSSAKPEHMFSFNHDVDWEQADNPNLKTNRPVTVDKRVTNNPAHEKDVSGQGCDHMADAEVLGLDNGRDTTIVNGTQEVLVTNVSTEGKERLEAAKKSSRLRNRVQAAEGTEESEGNAGLPPQSLTRKTTAELGLTQLSQLPPLPQQDDTDIGGPTLQRTFSKRSTEMNPMLEDFRCPIVEKNSMRDPLADAFYLDVWHTVAENNTKIFRNVFRCMPDNEVKTWKEYKEYAAYADRFAKVQGVDDEKSYVTHEDQSFNGGPPGHASFVGSIDELSAAGERKLEGGGGKVVDKAPGERPTGTPPPGSRGGSEEKECSNGLEPKSSQNSQSKSKTVNAGEQHSTQQLSEKVDATNSLSPTDSISAFPTLSFAPTDATGSEKTPVSGISSGSSPAVPSSTPQHGRTHHGTITSTNSQRISGANGGAGGSGAPRRRRTATRSSRREFHANDGPLDIRAAEEALQLVQGHLVVWPYDWLVREEQGGNWLYSIDQLAPLEIYN